MARVSEVYVGAEFGNLTVVSIGPPKGGGRDIQCHCLCGNDTSVRCGSLGKFTNSCGCKVAELVSKARSKHRQCSTSEYRSWAHMWGRCTNPKDPDYHLYKDRTPPDSWRDYAIFISDMGVKPSPKHTLERRDNSKGYSPDNCIWATQQCQNRNKSNVRLYTNGEKVLHLKEIGLLIGVQYQTLRVRLFRLGWSLDRALGPGWAIYMKAENDVI